MPQSHSSPGSSRPLPQRGTTAIVTTELEGLERQLGWARSMNSASCCTLQSLKNSGNDWLPVLKESKEISDLEKIQGSPVLLHLIKTVCIWAKVCGHPTILLFLSFPPDWSSYKAAGFACSCAAWSSVIMRTGEYISLKEEQRSALFSTEKMFFALLSTGFSRSVIFANSFRSHLSTLPHTWEHCTGVVRKPHDSHKVGSILWISFSFNWRGLTQTK